MATETEAPKRGGFSGWVVRKPLTAFWTTLAVVQNAVKGLRTTQPENPPRLGASVSVAIDYSPSFFADSVIVVSSSTSVPAGGSWETTTQLRSHSSIRSW